MAIGVVEVSLPSALKNSTPRPIFLRTNIHGFYQGSKLYHSSDTLNEVYCDIVDIYRRKFSSLINILNFDPPACSIPISEFAANGELYLKLSKEGKLAWFGGISLCVNYEDCDYTVHLHYCTQGGCSCYDPRREPLDNVLFKIEQAIREELNHDINKNAQIWEINDRSEPFFEATQLLEEILLVRRVILRKDIVYSVLINYNLEVDDARMWELCETFRREGLNSERLIRQVTDSDMDRLGMRIGEKIAFREYLGVRPEGAPPVNIIARDNAQINLRNNQIVGNGVANMRRVVNNMIVDDDESDEEII